jgi:hypothetical protein
VRHGIRRHILAVQVQILASTRVNPYFGGFLSPDAGISRTELRHDCIFSHPISINYSLSNQLQLFLLLMMAELICRSHRTSRAEVWDAAILTGHE